MTRTEIEKLSLAMALFFGGPGRAFLMTNGSFEALVAEFARRLRGLSDHEGAFDQLIANARRAADGAVQIAERQGVYAEFDGRKWPVLTEFSANLIARACPDNFKDY